MAVSFNGNKVFEKIKYNNKQVFEVRARSGSTSSYSVVWREDYGLSFDVRLIFEASCYVSYESCNGYDYDSYVYLKSVEIRPQSLTNIKTFKYSISKLEFSLAGPFGSPYTYSLNIDNNTVFSSSNIGHWTTIWAGNQRIVSSTYEMNKETMTVKFFLTPYLTLASSAETSLGFNFTDSFSMFFGYDESKINTLTSFYEYTVDSTSFYD